MSSAERFYRVLLRAYPADFRAAFGREMTLLFRDTRRATGSRLRFWTELVWDVARSAPRLRLDALRASNEDTCIREGRMKPMAIIAVLVGALEALGAGTEAWAGGCGRWCLAPCRRARARRRGDAHRRRGDATVARA